MCNIATHVANNRDWLIVEVPEDAVVCLSSNRTVLLYQLPPALAFNDPTWQIPLPEGEYSIYTSSDAITGEQANSLVEGSAISEALYKDYEGKKAGLAANTKSFQSLLRHLFTRIEKSKYIILIKNN